MELGGAGTTARCVVLLGGASHLYAVTGIGDDAVTLQRFIHEAGISCGLMSDFTRPSTRKERFTTPDNQQVIVLEKETRAPISRWVEDGLMGRIRETEASVVAVSDFGRGVVTESLSRRVSQFCQERGKHLIVDAREYSLERYRESFPYLTLVTPNLREASAMVGHPIGKSDEGIDDAGMTLRDELDCNVLITLSEDGARLYTIAGGIIPYEAPNKHPVCVSGGGDTMVATISLCLATGMSLPEACRIAQLAAGITVGKPGTGVATAAELMPLIERRILRQAV